MQKRLVIKLFSLCLILCFCKNSEGQTNLIFRDRAPILFPHSNTSFILNAPLKNNVSCLKLESNSKLPMFCAMEDKLHKRLNVWIKFRTGSDEFYRTLIALPRESKSKLID